MDFSKINSGNNPPEDINVIIEIPMRSDPIKYEIDHASGIILVNRIQPTAMYYPANYGFVPNTLGGDGDPIDVLVVCDYPLIVGSCINARPIGVLMMEDEGGVDEKIIAVPNHKVSKMYENIHNISDLPELFIKSIKHYFEHYKDLEPEKWVKVGSIESSQIAKQIIQKAILRSVR